MDVQQRRQFANNKQLDHGARQRLFAGFWQEWHPRLRVYYRSFGALSAEDGEELASDALLQAFERADSYRPERELAPWLYTVARRLALSRLRVLRRRPEQSTDPALFVDLAAAAEPGPEGCYMAGQERVLAARLLNGLPEKERELAYLVYGAELSLPQIARLTGEPLGTVKWRMSTIRTRMRKQAEVLYG
ncbi:MAG: RNA polymerase sigma factor [Spirochaetes bacterium]|nr:RNA polymerase sigma factor [Spirochaetota bacterium]